MLLFVFWLDHPPHGHSNKHNGNKPPKPIPSLWKNGSTNGWRFRDSNGWRFRESIDGNHSIRGRGRLCHRFSQGSIAFTGREGFAGNCRKIEGKFAFNELSIVFAEIVGKFSGPGDCQYRRISHKLILQKASIAND